jgi:hypothetical protein
MNERSCGNLTRLNSLDERLVCCQCAACPKFADPVPEEMDDLVAPSAAGLSLLLQLAQSRPKSTFMGTLGLINNVLSAP